MAHLVSLIALVSCLVSYVLSASYPQPSGVFFGAKPVNTSVTVDFISKPDSLDAPKISAINESVYDWWYFDVVSPDLKASLQMIFFAATPEAFPYIAGDPSAVSVAVFASFPNGTGNEYVMPAVNASVFFGGPLENDAVGHWVGANANFVGLTNRSQYLVSFDFMEAYGLKASLVLDTLVPAHYPCSASLAAGQNLQVFPGLGYANAVPLAAASGTMHYSTGTGVSSYTFGKGSTGYHDKNWGAVPFSKSVDTWFWGRVSVGPYAVVFFHGLDAQGAPRAMGYIANTHTRKIITSNCQASMTTVVAKYGKDETVESLAVTVDVPGSKEKLKVKIDAAVTVFYDPGVYGRWLGKVSGGMVGGKQYTGGSAVIERFPPAPKSG